MSRSIEWFVHNPIAANLLMYVLIVGGVAALWSLPREEFPDIDLGIVRISVAYRGAAPKEVEESLCVRIEEAIEGVQDVERVGSTATEGSCSVRVELLPDADEARALDAIKNRVDGIDTFPADADRPVVSLVVPRHDVIKVLVLGETDARGLKVLGQDLRDELVALPGVSQVDLDYTRPYEISIEVSEETLRRHGLSLVEVAHAVRRSSLDVPGGRVRAPGGEILLRTKGQAYRGPEFEAVVVLTRADGTALTLGEIGRVVDGFEEGDLHARADGRPAALLDVKSGEAEDSIEIAAAVRRWLPDALRRVPEGIELVVFHDKSQELSARLNALVGSARSGLVLVLIALGLFLRFRIAMWVAAGVPISFLGAVMLFPAFGITINTPVIMGSILVLGILVDDAIVVGESVHSEEQRLGDPLRAAVAGTRAVYVPVLFGVFTTIAAFAPMLMVAGRMGQVFEVLGATVILCLLFSLLEAHWILPAHLAHRRREGRSGRAGRVGSFWTGLQDRCSAWLDHLAQVRYRRALEQSLHWRYTTLAVAVGVLVLSAALVQSGRLRFQFFPSGEGDVVRALLTLPPGTPVEVTEAAVARLESGLAQLRAELDGDAREVIPLALTAVGAHRGDFGPGGARSENGSHLAEIRLELAPAEQRQVSAGEIARRWRDLTGPLPDALALRFEVQAFGAGEALALQLRGPDIDALARAAAEVGARLASYPGVYDVSDSFRGGKQEVVLGLRPDARTLGLTLDDLGRQVRQAFHGEEVQRVQRGRDDVRVMVRYPEEERRSLGTLEDMRIRTAEGAEVPFASVATAQLGRGYARIHRMDGERVVDVMGDVERSVTTPEKVIADLVQDLPELLGAYPGVTFSLEGEQRESGKAMVGLVRGGILALLVIYALLAVPLGSYAQPLIIMSVIPFGTVGASLGHLLMGVNLSFSSVVGMVALGGVVVNASLVLVHRVNRQLEALGDTRAALCAAGVSRFRPIFLTSLTTFVGLIPLMFESDPAAAMAIPLAISLAFGVAFASLITLFLVPSLYLILDDLRPLRVRGAGGRRGAAASRPGSESAARA